MGGITEEFQRKLYKMSKNNRNPQGGSAALDECLATTVEDGIVTGGVVTVGTPDGTCLMQAFGWMDRDRCLTMPADAFFDLASVTKVVGTTTALALCIDRGLLEPDAPFTIYLTDYCGTLPGPVTIRDLARHISGFPNQKPYDVVGEVVERILDFSPVRPAGEPYEYSCGNFILLGLIAERLLGADLNRICTDNVFAPLGMRDTRWAPLPNPDPRRVVVNGDCGTFGVASDPPARNANHPVGNAGLFSTAADLAIFSRMILARGTHEGRRILSERVVDFLGTRPDARSPAAFGWRVAAEFTPPSLSTRTMSHTGWAGNTLLIDPGKGKYVIVLTNRTGNHDKAQHIRLRIAELALRGVFG